jgi:hypothetical protein
MLLRCTAIYGETPKDKFDLGVNTPKSFGEVAVLENDLDSTPEPTSLASIFISLSIFQG